MSRVFTEPKPWPWFWRRPVGEPVGSDAVELFPGEQVAALRAEVAELRAVVDELAADVTAQFRTIAAHADIARTDAERVAGEATAGLERTRSMLIELIEQVRAECREALDRASGVTV